MMDKAAMVKAEKEAAGAETENLLNSKIFWSRVYLIALNRRGSTGESATKEANLAVQTRQILFGE